MPTKIPCLEHGTFKKECHAPKICTKSEEKYEKTKNALLV